MPQRFLASRHFSPCVVSLAIGLFAFACHDSGSGPTSPGTTGTVSGTVISGSSALSKRPLGVEFGLSGVTVQVVSNGRSTQTDSSGNFTLSGVPTGHVELSFDRSDIHARGFVDVASGTTTVTIAIAGSNATAVPGGHVGEEIEGLVQSVGAGTLTVLDQRLGAVVIHTDGSTLIRHGDSTIPLSQIQIGMRVHVKAMKQSDSSYLATEVLLQDENPGGNREVEGTVQSVSSPDFVVSSGGVLVTIHTDSSTMFKRHGGSASFSDLSPGVAVDVNGMLQSSGSVLARKVTIGG